eukprot:15959697-Heterocapsa_arctica.AAC.1
MAASRCGHCAKATRRGPDKAAGYVGLAGTSRRTETAQNSCRQEFWAVKFSSRSAPEVRR